MLLRYFERDDLEILSSNVGLNPENYAKKDNSWVEELLGKSPCYKTSHIASAGDFFPFISHPTNAEQKKEEDIENAIRIHEALINISRATAMNENMWICSCHTIKNVYEYIHNRWGTDMAETAIRHRYWCDGLPGLLRYNALSRLYWLADLSYDPGHKDPYHLLNIVFGYQKGVQHFMEGANRYNPNRIRGFLSAAEDYEKEFGGLELTRILNNVSKEFTRIGAAKHLDIYTEEEIKKLAYTYMIENTYKDFD